VTLFSGKACQLEDFPDLMQHCPPGSYASKTGTLARGIVFSLGEKKFLNNGSVETGMYGSSHQEDENHIRGSPTKILGYLLIFRKVTSYEMMGAHPQTPLCESDPRPPEGVHRTMGIDNNRAHQAPSYNVLKGSFWAIGSNRLRTSVSDKKETHLIHS
jgi:hypothetical protein